jgi:hypothetical protein
MTTTTKIPEQLKAAAERTGELNERLIKAGKRVGSCYLDGYEKLVENVTKYQQKLADQSKNEAVQTIVGTQVDLTRQLTSACTSAARELIA